MACWMWSQRKGLWGTPQATAACPGLPSWQGAPRVSSLAGDQRQNRGSQEASAEGGSHQQAQPPARAPGAGTGGFLSSDTALGLAAAPGAQLTPQTSLHSHWGWFGHGLQGTPAPAELHRDKVREEAQLLLRLSLELSGVHLGIWEGLKCFPGFCPVRIPGV